MKDDEDKAKKIVRDVKKKKIRNYRWSDSQRAKFAATMKAKRNG